MKFLLIAMFALTTVACSDATAPREITLADLTESNAVNPILFTPSQQYFTWFQEMEACSHLSYDYNKILGWYQVDRFKDSGFHVGTAVISGDKTAIYIRIEYLTTPNVVRHEILHALLRGDPTHSNPLWTNNVCGPL